MLLALAALVFAEAAPASPVSRDYYGASGNDVFVDPAVKASDQLAAMSAGGIAQVRFDAEWARVEPNPPDAQTGAHDYRWAYYDSRVESLARHGQRWYPVLAYNTSWSGATQGDLTSAPARVSDYAADAASLARRYGRGGSFWSAHSELTPPPVTSYEIWNEPNSQFFWHPQDQAPERYADLYAAARTAIRGVDSAARVVTGGLTVSTTGVTPEGDCLRRKDEHRPDLVGAADAVGYH